MEHGRKQHRWAPWVVAGLCAAPAMASLPFLDAPVGQSEPSLNFSIWSLGARALLERGPVEAKLGAVVAPYPGRGDGVYAHHPPLAVWLSVPLTALRAPAWAFRLFAVAVAVASLALLYRWLCLEVDGQSAVWGLGAAALCGYALVDARLFTTVTLCTPLWLLLLIELRRASGPPSPFGPGGVEGGPGFRPEANSPLRPSGVEGSAPTAARPAAAGRTLATAPGAEVSHARVSALVCLLVWSSWDGVLAAAAASAYLVVTRRAWWVLGAFGGALAPLVLYLVWANGGPNELVHQLAYRAANEGGAQTLATQVQYLAMGLGPLGLVLLLTSPRFRRQPRLWLAFVPGLAMVLLFRQGANHHAFWGHNLLVPLGYVAAAYAARVGTAAILVPALAAHAASVVPFAWLELERQRGLDEVGNQVAKVARDRPAGALAMFDWQAFHPYVTWLAPELVPEVVTSVRGLDEVRWRNELPVLVHVEFLERLGCAPLPAHDGARWTEASPEQLRAACAGR